MHDSHSTPRASGARRRALRPLRPRKRPRQERSRGTVDAIVEAVFRILETEGVAAVTTTHVAKRAGVSVGSLYQYFPGRVALLEAARRRHADASLRVLDADARASRGSPVAERVRALVAAQLAFKRARPRLSVALLRARDGELGDAVKRRTADLYQRRLASLLEEHAAELGGADPRAVAARIVGAVEGALARSLRDPAALAAVDLQDVLARVALAALPAVSAPPRS